MYLKNVTNKLCGRWESLSSHPESIQYYSKLSRRRLGYSQVTFFSPRVYTILLKILCNRPAQPLQFIWTIFQSVSRTYLDHIQRSFLTVKTIVTDSFLHALLILRLSSNILHCLIWSMMHSIPFHRLLHFFINDTFCASHDILLKSHDLLFMLHDHHNIKYVVHDTFIHITWFSHSHHIMW